ncbi:hypothetical protein M2163_001152 [Streptomyces sp. SAI-135]|uniref:hypothetical protein n=1 Tax=Streptomyces TaxID=1883 RepID=UPI0015E87011|nr:MULTISPECIES: hypothetical protein [Streptomyces]MDH6521855.1 hypothetical protein [Streptomyces sp. SAI-090]MDH6573221.1 hypothetical protein [Streptomyces sp. SAI-117]MDH6614044.1 hypothetical protein [Streptomyces sp. SAI-135]
MLEQLGRAHATGLGQLRPRQRQNGDISNNILRLGRHTIMLTLPKPQPPQN